MRTYTLTRSKQIPDGVFGRLEGPNLGGGLFTMEDDWLNNQVGKSCIPAGTYRIKRSFHHPGDPKGYECFEIVGVPGRSYIQLHIANYEEQVEGCVGLGLHLEKMPVKRDEDTGELNVLKLAVANSHAAHERWMDAMEGVNEAILIVRWAEGLPTTI